MKGLARSMRNGLALQSGMKKLTIPVRNLAISVAGASGVGFGSAVIAGLPQANIAVLAAIGYLQFSTVDVDVVNTFTGNYSVGSAATADATLSGSEIDVLPSVAISAAVAGVSPVTRAANATAVMIDNTDSSKNLNLNMLVADASISSQGDFLVNGYIQIAYVALGDD